MVDAAVASGDAAAFVSAKTVADDDGLAEGSGEVVLGLAEVDHVAVPTRPDLTRRHRRRLQHVERTRHTRHARHTQPLLGVNPLRSLYDKHLAPLPTGQPQTGNRKETAGKWQPPSRQRELRQGCEPAPVILTKHTFDRKATRPIAARTVLVDGRRRIGGVAAPVPDRAVGDDGASVAASGRRHARG